LEFLGGIDPQLVLIGFFVIGMAIVSVGCMSLLVSIYARSMTRALLESYAYMLAFGACVIGIPITISQKAYDLTAVFVLTETFGFITGSLSVIHVLFAVVRLRKANQGSTPWPVRPLGFPSYDELPQDFREIFPLHESASGIDWPIDRPRVSDSPAFWKEVTSWNISSVLALNLVCFIGFVFLLCLGLDFSARLSDQNEFIKNASPWGVAILSFLVGIMSSRMIAKERQKRTLDALVLTCLDAKEILAGKRNACITRIYWSFIFGMVVLALAVLNDAIYVAAFFCFILAAVVYIAFFACVGLFISTRCTTSLKAMLIFTVIFISFGLGGMADLDPLDLKSRFTSWTERVILYVVSPLSTLQELTFNERRYLDNTRDIAAALAAVAVLAVATWFLWKWTVFSFERSTGGRPPKRRHPVPVS
jgi:ABC-type transport system involved in multi-copper enzyme maturation permease subunit